MNEQRLAERAAGRQQATAIIELICETLTPDRSQEWLDAFWEEIEENLEQTNRPKKETDGLQPMTATQAVRFESELCPFQKFKGTPVRLVPKEYLDYLVGQQTDPESFLNKAARYLKNPQIAEQLKAELEQDAPWNQPQE